MSGDSRSNPGFRHPRSQHVEFRVEDQVTALLAKDGTTRYQRSSISALVQYWDGRDSTTPKYNSGLVFVRPLSDTVKAGSTLKIWLDTDNTGCVTGATFVFIDNTGNVNSQVLSLPAEFQYPIVAFQANIVGPYNKADAHFSSGAGTITYSSDGELCLEGGVPDLCSKAVPAGCAYTRTQETSNTDYGYITQCCGSQLTQSLTLINP
jgi:hypothetical protein